MGTDSARGLQVMQHVWRSIAVSARACVAAGAALAGCAGGAPSHEPVGHVGGDGGDASAPASLAGCTPPLLFGHRGTILFAPENTLPAYAYAVDKGGDGIEVDLHVTADGALVAMHDRTLARTTDAGDMAVRDVSLAELAAFDAGSWFAPEFAGTRIPSLDTVLDRFGPGDTRFLFDIKEAEAVTPLAAAVTERDLAARAIVSSTSLDVLRDFEALIPEVPALYYPSSLDALGAINVPNVRYVRVPKSIEDDPSHVRRIREAGYEVAISGRFVQWASADTVFTAIGLVNNMALTSERRHDRCPPECRSVCGL